MSSDPPLASWIPAEEFEPPATNPQPSRLPFFARRLQSRLQVQSGISGGYIIKAAGRG